jgi:hypothetical protein
MVGRDLLSSRTGAVQLMNEVDQSPECFEFDEAALKPHSAVSLSLGVLRKDGNAQDRVHRIR